eukprot:1831467-Rhodomonas_salina.2
MSMSLGNNLFLSLLLFLYWGVFFERSGATEPGKSAVSVFSMTETDLDDEQHLRDLLAGCGDICNTSIVGVPSKFFPHVRKNVNCTALMSNGAIDAGRDGGARGLPALMKGHFTYNGRVKFGFYRKQLLDQKYVGNPTPLLWSKLLIDQQVKLCQTGHLHGSYGVQETKRLVRALKGMSGLKHGHVLVIGSERPWVEACVLGVGAREVTTLEYRAIKSSHPRVHSLLPSEMRSRFLAGTLPVFDAVVSFASVGHSGLGRYGDAFNPWGDLLAIARAWCVCKPGGELANGVSAGGISGGGGSDGDVILYNAQRVYGPVMNSQLYANWEQVDMFVGPHTIFVVRKPLV